MNTPKTLLSKQIVEITPSAPFNFDATMHKPDHFPSSDSEWAPGIRWQTMRWQGQNLGLKLENRGTLERPAILLSIWSAEPLSQDFLGELIDETNYRYNFQLDLTDFNRRFATIPRVKQVLTRWRGMRPLNHSSLYDYLIVAIVLQNATVRRSVSMMQALLENHGILLAYDGKKLYCAWAPGDMEGVTEPELRQLKVGYRARSILRVTAAFLNREISESALRLRSREEQRKALLALYGIGPASVGYILSDVFHHLDEMEHISPWEQKIFSKVFFDVDPEHPVAVEEILAFFGEHFAGYRQLAVHYFWEDLFWRRRTEHLEWLERLIRL